MFEKLLRLQKKETKKKYVINITVKPYVLYLFQKLRCWNSLFVLTKDKYLKYFSTKKLITYLITQMFIVILSM
jgi:hypothetical protein